MRTPAKKRQRKWNRVCCREMCSRCHCPLGHRGAVRDWHARRQCQMRESGSFGLSQSVSAAAEVLVRRQPLLPGLAPLGQASVHFQNPSDNSDHILPDIAGIGQLKPSRGNRAGMGPASHRANLLTQLLFIKTSPGSWHAGSSTEDSEG